VKVHAFLHYNPRNKVHLGQPLKSVEYLDAD